MRIIIFTIQLVLLSTCKPKYQQPNEMGKIIEANKYQLICTILFVTKFHKKKRQTWSTAAYIFVGNLRKENEKNARKRVDAWQMSSGTVLDLQETNYSCFWAWISTDVCRHVGLKHGQWRLKICSLADGEVDVWSSDEGKKAKWGFVVFWAFRVWLRWWGVADCDGLGIWNVRVGCRPVEMWRW